MSDKIQWLILTEGGLNPPSANLHNIPELTLARHVNLTHFHTLNMESTCQDTMVLSSS